MRQLRCINWNRQEIVWAYETKARFVSKLNMRRRQFVLICEPYLERISNNLRHPLQNTICSPNFKISKVVQSPTPRSPPSFEALTQMIIRFLVFPILGYLAFQDFWADCLLLRFWEAFIINPLFSSNCDPNIVSDE